MHEKLKEVCKQIGVRRSARGSRNESKSWGHFSQINQKTVGPKTEEPKKTITEEKHVRKVREADWKTRSRPQTSLGIWK